MTSSARSPSAVVENEERAEMLRQALLRLPETHRVVVVLRHYENLKFREIADALDLPEGTVKSRMADALTQLARWLRHLREPVDIKQRTLHDSSGP
jgi:RNA polymerase sigma-70 factor (ECF subfamily)